MALRILLTGFEPFGGSLYNPSGDVAAALNGEEVRATSAPDARRGTLHSVVLPVLWNDAGRAVRDAIARVRPHVVIALGMAHGAFRVEQIASDRRVDRIDNAGVSLGVTPGTRRIATALPRREIERWLVDVVGREHVVESDDAGGFICEEVFFAVMNAIHEPTRQPRIARAGFIHVPNDVFVPSVLPEALLAKAIRGAASLTLDALRDDAALEP